MKKERKTRNLTPKDILGKNLEKSIKDKKILFGLVENTSTKEQKSEKYVSEKNKKGAYIEAEKIQKLGSLQPRFFLTLVSKSKSKNVISGEWARKCFNAINYVPKSKQSDLSEQEINELNEAFGF